MALTSETRSVPGLTGVTLRGYGDLVIEQDAGAAGRETVIVEADESIIGRILTEVRGGLLVIGFTMPWYEWLSWGFQWLFTADKRVRFRLSAATVERVSISGAGRATAPRLEARRLEATISGAGRIALDGIAASDVESRVSGAGNIELSGAADSHDARISGAGSVRATRLATKRTTVSISGSGSMAANASDTLDARISGAGSVSYTGAPRVTQHVTGAGRVRQAG